MQHTVGTDTPETRAVHHRTATIDGRTVFYREAGDRSAPTLLLLHGFPTSSHMFRRLILDLADSFHLVAPDHLGFGYSDAPPVTDFDYSFDNLTATTEGLIDHLGLDRFALYLQDYGAPIGQRLALRDPDRVTALVVQSGNAYVEGFTPFWDVLFAHAKDRATHEAEVRTLLSPASTRWQYTHGVPADRLDRLTPDTWNLDQSLLDRPGNDAVQLQLFWDYQFNLDVYPDFQAYLRAHRPPTLVAWGEHDEIFGADGARAFLRDVPDAELHLLDAGHFALETHGEEICALVRDFLTRALAGEGR
ncbi:MAG: putative hydrolase [Cellulosimicrobium sp.]|jgi:pimeloyl-ACP methyl ester carboxylesterase|nr:putative hydrolase [Cellulosimicrobium sp.]